MAKTIHQSKAEETARSLAYYTSAHTARHHTASGSIDVIVAFRVPSSKTIGVERTITIHRPRSTDWTYPPAAKDWHLWECDCEWSEHHSPRMGENACSHLRAARIFWRIEHELSRGIGIDWWDRIRNHPTICIRDPLLIPPAIIPAMMGEIQDLIKRLADGEFPFGSEKYIAARLAQEYMATAAHTDPSARRPMPVHTAPMEEI